MSPRRLSDISPQIRQLKSLVIDEDLSEELKSSRSVEYINNASIEERILRITGYYGYEPWNGPLRGILDSYEVSLNSHFHSSTDCIIFICDSLFACVWIHDRECCQFLGDDVLSLRMLLSRVAPFGVLWTLTSYLYLQGLRAFVFLISWIVPRDRFMGVRVSL
uniref:Uncharacterized protein n=1 Tax=Sinocyclocheilus rhinocerous TaxID=307959 RepID=A0A673N0J9_9TELE